MTEVIIGEKDPIPFPSIMGLLQTELLATHEDSVIITDLQIIIDPGTLRKIIETDIEDESLRIRLFSELIKERSMSDVIRITEGIVNDPKIRPVPTQPEKDAATALLHSLFDERARHNEQIISKIRGSAREGDQDKLHAMLWDDEGHTSVVLYCAPKYYFLDSCGCKQFGRHPMEPIDHDHPLVSRTQFDGYNCRTMSYIMIENALRTFNDKGGKDGFNTYFTSPNYFGAHVGIRPYGMRMANGANIHIMCERNPQDIIGRELTDPISIPPEIRVIAQRSAVFKAYYALFEDRIRNFNQLVAESTKLEERIQEAQKQTTRIEEALKKVFEQKIRDSGKFNGREGEISGEVDRLFVVLRESKFERTALDGKNDYNIVAKDIQGTCSRLKTATVLMQKVGRLREMRQQLETERAEVEELKIRLPQIKPEIERAGLSIIIGEAKSEDSGAVVAKRTANLDSLREAATIALGTPPPPKLVVTGKSTMDSHVLGVK